MVADRGVGPRLVGRCAVVVGAGQTPGATIGNGRATAVQFARHGARVALVDRSAEQLAGTVAMIRAEVPDAEFVEVVADIATDDGPAEVVAAAVTAFGGFDILHNNV
ncbi:MAG: SDR family NAD(P)-dependent oxidoreductase, partial [Ilumatobacter sp.]|nr:SDR family NAD(P)-dependent oxidoreductase [Ilumatobacter sp.]